MLASALSNAFTLITALLHLRFIKRFYADNGVVTLALVIESLVKNRLNIFTPRIDYGTCYVVLSFEPINGILWCDHSNNTFSAELLHGNICFSIFYKMKFAFFSLEF